MKKSDIKIKRYGVFNHLRYEVQFNGKTLFSLQSKKEAKRIAQIIKCLIVIIKSKEDYRGKPSLLNIALIGDIQEAKESLKNAGIDL